MSNLTEEQIRQQSISCYSQWAEQWRKQAKYHGERFEMKSFNDFHQIGVGKAALCVANGYSFEENIETIKKYKDNVDVVACDKTVGHCLDNGIKPKFVVVCDANVSYEKYLEPWKDQLEESILISNVCGATKWASCGNWKDVYFFVNQDVLKSEREFQALSGCPNVIVAGTNVSNAMVIILSQCNNDGARNWMGYDKILLIGFDYSWDQNYYAFDQDGGGKINYMRNIFLCDMNNDYCFSSPNLMFSARWFDQYVKTFGLPVVQCSKKSIVTGAVQGNLAEQMQYEYQPEDSQLVRDKVKLREECEQKIAELTDQLGSIAFDHIQAFKRTT
jgi:hypothetical protein